MVSWGSQMEKLYSKESAPGRSPGLSHVTVQAAVVRVGVAGTLDCPRTQVGWLFGGAFGDAPSISWGLWSTTVPTYIIEGLTKPLRQRAPVLAGDGVKGG